MPLNVLGPFIAHHQEAARVCVTNGFCFPTKSSVGGPGWEGISFPSRPVDRRLGRKTNTICHIYLMMDYKLAQNMQRHGNSIK
jgi:hypothetical protein